MSGCAGCFGCGGCQESGGGPCPQRQRSCRESIDSKSPKGRRERPCELQLEMPFHVHEINDLSQLAEWRADWQQLLAQTPDATFFHSLEWLGVYWRHFGDGQSLRVILLVDGEHLRGVVPLVVRTENRHIGRVRVLTYPLDDWGSFYSPIGPDGRELLDAALSHVQQTPKKWDLLSLRWVSRENLSQAQEAMRWVGLKGFDSVRDRTGLVDLKGSWDEYAARWNSKFRSNLRRCERRLSEQGELEFVRYRPEAGTKADPRLDLYEECEQVALASWQSSSMNGTTITHDAVRSFFRDLHAVAADCGTLDLNLLRLSGKPIAYAYNYQLAGSVFGARCGYDPEYGRFGIGTLIFAKAIEDGFQRGDVLYDLGPGSVECKKRFATRFADSCQLTYYRPFRVKSQLLRLKQVASSWKKRDQAD